MTDKSQTIGIVSIQNHNIYTDTDRLYDPLRRALKKSESPPNRNICRMLNSSLSNNLRALSPDQANKIKKSVYIPIDKRLVSTKNVEKVRGKQFTAIDIQQKVGTAVSSFQISRKKSQKIEQIVYEMKDQENKQKINILDPNGKTLQKSKSTQFNSINLASMPNVSSGQRISFASDDSNHKLWASYQSKQLLTQTSTVKYAKNQISRMQTSRMNQIESANKNRNFLGKSYIFKHNLDHDIQNKPIRKRGQLNNNYNLFSMVDHLGSKVCSACPNNFQIVASKIDNNPWK